MVAWLPRGERGDEGPKTPVRPEALLRDTIRKNFVIRKFNRE